MDYYTFRKSVFSTIKKIVKAGDVQKKILIFNVLENTGASKKMINQYIDELIDNDRITEKNGILKWKK